ncbi:MAG: RHS repeat-associated core domain-containing protein, partial [bacterium]
TPTMDYFYLGNLLVASRDGYGGLYYHFTDHLGSVRSVTGAANEVHSYDPWGRPLSGSNSGVTPIRYAGMERDSDSVNDYDHARFKSMNLGRFLGVDLHSGSPQAPQSWNRYTYALDNPVRLLDANGLAPQDAVGRSVWGVSAWMGPTAAYDAALRGSYARTASQLTDSAARTALKMQVRALSDPVARSIADSMRPMADEASRIGGTVTKTNEAVNSAMGLAGRVGTGFTLFAAGVSVYNVATAPEGQMGVTASREGGAWAGALSFGWGGAQLGAIVGGPVGAAVGGVVGAAVGAVAGSQAGENTFHLFTPSSSSSGGCSFLFGCTQAAAPPAL